MQINSKHTNAQTKERVFAACNKILGKSFASHNDLVLEEAHIATAGVHTSPQSRNNDTPHANHITPHER